MAGGASGDLGRREPADVRSGGGGAAGACVGVTGAAGVRGGGGGAAGCWGRRMSSIWDGSMIPSLITLGMKLDDVVLGVALELDGSIVGDVAHGTTSSSHIYNMIRHT
jgi:hypothetical protein